MNFKPRFVAIADTHAWNWQTLSLAENQIGNFVNETYGGDASSKNSGQRRRKMVCVDGERRERKFSLLSEGSQIFFGNDESAIEKCLAVKRGEADSLLKNEDFRRAYAANAENKLAFGYVSTEGVAQIANLAGVSSAIEATEEADGQKFYRARFAADFAKHDQRNRLDGEQKLNTESKINFRFL